MVALRSEKAWESERASKEVALEALAALRASDVCVERDLEQVTPIDCTLIMRWSVGVLIIAVFL